VICLLTVLGSCTQETYRSARDLAPMPAKTLALIADRGTDTGAHLLMRSFKNESEIEAWKLGRDGTYALLKTFAPGVHHVRALAKFLCSGRLR